MMNYLSCLVVRDWLIGLATKLDQQTEQVGGKQSCFFNQTQAKVPLNCGLFYQAQCLLISSRNATQEISSKTQQFFGSKLKKYDKTQFLRNSIHLICCQKSQNKPGLSCSKTKVPFPKIGFIKKVRILKSEMSTYNSV